MLLHQTAGRVDQSIAEPERVAAPMLNTNQGAPTTLLEFNAF